MGSDHLEGVEVVQLNREIVLAQLVCRLSEQRGAPQVALGLNDLGLGLPLGLRGNCHGAVHALWELNLLSLDAEHLQAVGDGLLVDDPC